MCYHIKNKKKEPVLIERCFDLRPLKIDVPPFYYHLNGFDRGQVMVITQEEQEIIQTATWSVAPPNCTDIQGYWKQKGGSVLNTRDDSLFSPKLAEWKSEAVLYQKCIIIVSGFYEPHRSNDISYPYLLYKEDYNLFGLLGYYTNQEDFLTCSILTTTADDYLSKIHNKAKRMPLTLDPTDVEYYLNLNTEENLKREFKEFRSIELLNKPVDKSVLNSRVDSNKKEILQEMYYPELNTLFK